MLVVGTARLHALSNIWGQTDVQSKLDSVKRNKDIFLQVARDLQDLGRGSSLELK